MSRWILALVCFGFALTPVRADPKPLWEIDTVSDAKRLHGVLWVGFSPDGKTLVAQVEDRTLNDRNERLIAWDAATRKEQFRSTVAEDLLGVGWNKRSNAFTKTGTVLTAGGSPTEIRLADGMAVKEKIRRGAVAAWFDPNSGEAVWLLEVDSGWMYSLAVGKMPPFGADKKPTDNWLVEPLKQRGDLLYSAFTVSPDATHFVAAWDDKKAEKQFLALFALAKTDKLKLTEVAVVPSAQIGRLSKIQFSPDGKTLATGSDDSTICLWDVEKAGKNWEPRATITAGGNTVGALAFSPDGRTLAAGTWDKGRATLFLIDVTAGKSVASYRETGQFMCLAYSPDGKTLVSGDYSGRIKAWDAEALRNP